MIRAIEKAINEPLSEDDGVRSIQEAFNETWSAALHLLREHVEVYFFSVNYGEAMTTRPGIETFAFDYAVATNREQAEAIKAKIMEYRTVGWTTPEDMAKRLDEISSMAMGHPHAVGYWR